MHYVLGIHDFDSISNVNTIYYIVNKVRYCIKALHNCGNLYLGTMVLHISAWLLIKLPIIRLI